MLKYFSICVLRVSKFRDRLPRSEEDGDERERKIKETKGRSKKAHHTESPVRIHTARLRGARIPVKVPRSLSNNSVLFASAGLLLLSSLSPGALFLSPVAYNPQPLILSALSRAHLSPLLSLSHSASSSFSPSR